MVEAKRALADALAHLETPADRRRAVTIYRELTDVETPAPVDVVGFAFLLMGEERYADAKSVVLSGIAKCPDEGVRQVAEAGQTIVRELGDRDFRKRLEKAIAERWRE